MKKIEHMSFDDLVTDACWSVMQGLTRGESLRSLMYHTLTLAIQWSNEKSKTTSNGK